MEQMEMQEESPIRRRSTWSHWVTKQKLKKFAFNLFVAALVYFVCRMTILKGDVEKPAQCQTVECIQAANHILSYINQTADPCDDFYKFTCGKFHEGNIAMEKKTFLDEMDENIQKIQDQLLTSVNIDDSKFNTNLQVARSFYKVCINKAAVNQDKDRTYVDTMLKLVSDAGDKPLWQNVTLNARKYGIDYDFFLNVSVAWIPKTHLLMIAPPYISPHWFKMLWQSNNTEYIKKVAQYWMSDYIPQWFLADPDKIVDFANQFQKIVLESTPVASNVRQKIRPISELKQTDYFNRDWLVFLRELTGIESFEDSDEVLYLIDNGNTDNYLSKLHDLMERTHWSVWANYMIIMNTAQLSGLLSSPVQHIFEELIPNFVETAKTESCKDLTQIMFPGAQETEYIKMLMNTKKQKHVQAIMDKLKLVMVNSIKDILSVNHSSTDVVLDELRNIASVIGSDSNLHNSSDHAQNGAQYGKEIVSNSLIDMYFKIKKVEISYFFNYTQMENQADVRNPIMSISMYYVREENTIYVPAPVLQRPIYDTNWPQYLNYGALGAMIGHELMHALLTTYIALDVDPNNQTGYTIGEETEEFGSCEYDKYLEYLTERYFPTNITADTLHESMADFGGQNLAYKSYQSWVKEHGLEPELPGVNYTANQIFWIMSSIHLCHDANLEHPDKMQEYLTSEIAYYYPVPSYRVNGPKVNSPSFAKDFSCQRNAKMNPNNKCTSIV
ncbi:membrane metallo-endopeptidase-like 1 [Dendroctonus ponderosae]|uniref:membrane metallo-endopeptidase-like 1 n=1 Tax=Dendroctonus ponderosae TaxID=77166 RepID=UPI00203595DF|nr:membrane metallo-endopeptidase-like 1 [Dendroctonus ponderosae]